MDKLKEIMALKKPTSKVIVQKQLIQQQKQQFIKSQSQNKRNRELEQQKKMQQIADFYGKARKIVKVQQEQTPPIPIQQVKERLRKLYQPVTLFGQKPYRRYERLLKAQKFHQTHPNQDMKLYDEEFIKKLKQNQQYDQLDAKYREFLIEPKILNDPILRKKKQTMILNQQKPNMGQMCDEIHLWIIKVLKGWSQLLEQRYHNKENKTENSKFQLLIETQNQLSTFYQVLKERSGDKEMIQSIYYIMNCCLIREYVQANTRYIELSIGNAPWPMGVAMLGITVRKNAERLSYVLDNQITRKWMQGIKRLVTVSQQIYPHQDRMKMVGYTVLKFT